MDLSLESDWRKYHVKRRKYWMERNWSWPADKTHKTVVSGHSVFRSTLELYHWTQVLRRAFGIVSFHVKLANVLTWTHKLSATIMNYKYNEAVWLCLHNLCSKSPTMRIYLFTSLLPYFLIFIITLEHIQVRLLRCRGRKRPKNLLGKATKYQTE